MPIGDRDPILGPWPATSARVRGDGCGTTAARRQRTMSDQEIKVAILGGGMASLATAVELLSTPSPDGRPYQITIYEKDWRLGGKGASGRNNSDSTQRIEEHGLHILLGFYDNVFAILKKVYTGVPAGGAWWSSFLQPFDHVFLAEQHREDWSFWRLAFNANDKVPGVDVGMPDAASLLYAAFEYFRLNSRPTADETISMLDWDKLDAGTQRRLEEQSLELDQFHRATPNAFLDELANEALGDEIVNVVSKVLNGIWKMLESWIVRSSARRQWFKQLCFAGVNLIGAIHDDLLGGALDSVETSDYRAWLKKHDPVHLADEYLARSPLVNVLYDLIFSGETTFSAASALRGATAMLLGYKGHLYYKMRGGMGDVVFAPIYDWLLSTKQVRFEFFCEVTDIKLAGDRVAEISLHRSRAVPQGDYDPIIPVAGMRCWPSAAKPEAVAPARPDFPLTDFDIVVLGISLGGLPPICAQLRAASPAFAAMLDGLGTIATKAMQLWMTPTENQLGWTRSGADYSATRGPTDGPMVGSYAAPFNSFADMEQTLDKEMWSATPVSPPATVVYLCDRADDDITEAKVRALAKDWLAKEAYAIWPRFERGAIPYDVFAAPPGLKDEARFQYQYFRANTEGSARYVLSRAGTAALRFTPGGRAPDGTRPFSNLYLAGDWVRTTLNIGCLEAASESGRLAARAIADDLRATPAPSRLQPGDGGGYVENGLVLHHPVELRGALLYGYPIQCDRQRLAALLQRNFNAPSRGRVQCEPTLPYVLMTVASIPRIASGDAPDGPYLTENEVAFWVPCRVTSDGASELAWFVPYMLVDDPAAQLAGREIFGLPKIMARNLPTIDKDSLARPAAFNAAVQAIPLGATGGPVQWLTAVGLTSQVATRKEHSHLKAVGYAILNEVAESRSLSELLGSFNFERIALVSLKQQRSVANGAVASYQAVLRYPGTLTKFRGGGVFTGEFALTLPEHASLQIARDLGIELSGETRKLRFGFWLDFDFELGRGTELAL
jgi:uncharacterized protein with NAD-binding domain and iron-sulfur cluster